jgi:hypothetical protein
VLLLPENFFSTDLGEDVLLSALSHECAHIQRGDFALNLLYEILYLTVCFHPCTAFMRSRIAHTRELACDEMAVGMLPCQARYATSLLDFAQSMFWGNRPPATYALGLFDTNALEERIMNILKSTKASSKWARVLRLTAVSLVGAVALAISAFSLTVAVENATSLGQFTGTWQCKYRGQPFFTLNMAVAGGVLGGTAVHPTRVAWVDGELLPGSAVNPSEADEMVQGEIFDAHLSDQQLFIKIADGPDKSDVLQLSFKLVGKDEAEAMAVIEKTSEGPPPQKKPWHFQRVSQ